MKMQTKMTTVIQITQRKGMTRIDSDNFTGCGPYHDDPSGSVMMPLGLLNIVFIIINQLVHCVGENVTKEHYDVRAF